MPSLSTTSAAMVSETLQGRNEVGRTYIVSTCQARVRDGKHECMEKDREEKSSLYRLSHGRSINSHATHDTPRRKP